MEGPSTNAVDKEMDEGKHNQEEEKLPVESPLPQVQDRCTEILVNVALLSNGINIGLIMGILGPSLPDLALQTGSSILDMNVVFAFCSIAYILGSLLSGLFLGRIEGYLLASVALILQALCVAVAPWCTNLVSLTIFISMAYFFNTVIIAGTAFLCFKLERARARVMAQTVSLLFNLGKALVPFILAPFLSPERVVEEPINSITGLPPLPSGPESWLNHSKNLQSSKNATIMFINGKQEYTASRISDKHQTHIRYGYAIIASYILLLSLLHMLIVFKHGCHFWALDNERIKDTKSDAPTGISISTSKIRNASMLLAFLIMIFLQAGIEAVDVGLLMTFMTEYLHHSKNMGVVATIVYQSVKVVTCTIIVLTVKYIHPSSLFFVNSLFTCTATFLMVMSIYFSLGDGLLFTTFVLLAIGMSNTYATLGSWFETHYVITGIIAGAGTVDFGLGGMILPILTNTLLDKKGPIMFPLVLFVCSILSFLTYLINKLLMQETLCPKIDIGDVPMREITLTSSEQQGLLEGVTEVTDGGAISQTYHKEKDNHSGSY